MKKILALGLCLLTLSPVIAYSEGLFSNSNFGFLNDAPKLMPVDKALVFEAEQQGNYVKLSWVIADGYYLYRDKLKFEATGATLGEIYRPQGKMHHDDYFGNQRVYRSYIEIPVAIKQASSGANLTVTFMGCAEGKLCFPPTKRTINLTSVAANDGLLSAKFQDKQTTATQQSDLGQMLKKDNLLWTLAVFFVLGIGLAFTPCVFPMYPILSGIIVGQGEKLSIARAFGLSMVYVQGMAITYSLLGLVVASAGMKYQAALQHPAVLITLAILFFCLSLSMFGLFDLKLPASWQNRLNSLSSRQRGGNLIGVFIMGVISGLVASPCTTAPLSGALVYVAQTGDLLQGFLTLYVLSMGMGVPLLLIGSSGGKLLPKAGAWMTIIKTIFGFLLIAVSIMMLGRIWPGIVSDLLWAFWGVSLVGYLIHRNRLTPFSWQQSARFVVLLLLLLGSFSYGFQAMMTYLGFQHSGIVNGSAQSVVSHEKVKSIADLNAKIAEAKAQGKPVLVDLYADWCVACKEFENITFKDPDVQQKLSKMVFVQADVTANDAVDIELLEHYRVLGLPTLLLFDRQGNIRDDLRINGFMKPAEFAAQLDLLLGATDL